MVTICVTTAATATASRVGEAYTAAAGAWRNAVDGCDAHGCGRVFLDFPDQGAADAATDLMDEDADVVSYRQVTA